ncbi:CP12 [Scenedesmus sp. PABB004]|nr:CP12 [Scenedesmus sp. PABB004]
MRSVRASPVARAAGPRAVSVRPLPRVAMRSSTPDKAAVETAIKEAEEKCADGTAGECAAAWDNVEEISAAISHKKVADAASSDPLEQFCGENPDADECRVYDD